jgi:hypothetical protein
LSVIDPDPSVYLLLGAWRIRLGARANQSKHRQLMCHGAVLIDAAVFLLGESSRRLFARRFPAADEFQVGAVSSQNLYAHYLIAAGSRARADFVFDQIIFLQADNAFAMQDRHVDEMLTAIDVVAFWPNESKPATFVEKLHSSGNHIQS